jgi:hypothetical protein
VLWSGRGSGSLKIVPAVLRSRLWQRTARDRRKSQPLRRSMALEVCREFGISRKTGYKIFDRYEECGLTALNDRSRRPVRYANQLLQQVESLIVRLRAEKPHWVHARSASSWCGGATVTSRYRPKALSMRFSTATAWSSGAAGCATAARHAAVARRSAQ